MEAGFLVPLLIDKVENMGSLDVLICPAYSVALKEEGGLS
jgi:hypothetical protein